VRHAVLFLVSPEAVNALDHANLEWPEENPDYRVQMEKRSMMRSNPPNKALQPTPHSGAAERRRWMLNHVFVEATHEMRPLRQVFT
jgi:hypothetical protein